MGENSAIEWTDHTFNPWVGCTKVSSACDHCYAEGWAKRTGHPELWAGEHRRTSKENWRKPKIWNHNAQVRGERRKVFCASLADVFDNQVPDEWRADLWALIKATPHLDWLLLTKRPQNIAKMLPADFNGGTWPNVWMGATAETQDDLLRRWAYLRNIKARIRFLSCEPLLSALDTAEVFYVSEECEYQNQRRQMIDWVICGGESGPRRRPMNIDWARNLRDDCKRAGVAFFMKQIDKVQPIPADLMIREFPHA